MVVNMVRTPKRNPTMNCKRVCNGLVFAIKEHLELDLLPKCNNCEAKELKIEELMGVHKENKREKIIENNLLQLQSMTQTCKECDVEKTLTKFHKDKRGKYGRRRVCKSCLEISESPYTGNPVIKNRIKEINKRQQEKRKPLKWKALNEPQQGFERHHINNEFVIYMPQPLHILYGHRLNDAESMTKVNELAFKYLLSNQDSIIVPIELIHELKNKLLK